MNLEGKTFTKLKEDTAEQKKTDMGNRKRNSENYYLKEVFFCNKLDDIFEYYKAATKILQIKEK